MAAVALIITSAILTEAGLSYLGISDPNVVSWGQLIDNAQSFLHLAWWLSVFPGLAIMIMVLGITLVADGLSTD
jgi:peptide/nickel transport system permease protein